MSEGCNHLYTCNEIGREVSLVGRIALIRMRSKLISAH